MFITPIISRAEALRIAQQGHTQTEITGHRGIAEFLLGVVLDATCDVGSPVILNVQIGEPLRESPFDVDARLAHAEGAQQRWFAEVTQAGMPVGRAYIVMEAELPSSSYVPWRGANPPVWYAHDNGVAHCLRVTRLLDTVLQARANGKALVPLWFTIRYFGGAAQFTRLSEPLTISAMGEQRLGTLQQYETKVCQGNEMVATLTAVYQHDHA